MSQRDFVGLYRGSYLRLIYTPRAGFDRVELGQVW